MQQLSKNQVHALSLLSQSCGVLHFSDFDKEQIPDVTLTALRKRALIFCNGKSNEGFYSLTADGDSLIKELYRMSEVTSNPKKLGLFDFLALLSKRVPSS